MLPVKNGFKGLENGARGSNSGFHGCSRMIRILGMAPFGQYETLLAAGAVLLATAAPPGMASQASAPPLKWERPFSTGDSVYASPAVGWNGLVHVGSQDYSLYAIDPEGVQEWDFETYDRDWIHASAAVDAEGTVYVGALDFFVYALDPDGLLLWMFETESFIFSSPSVGRDGNIYFGCYDQYLYSLDPDGIPRWIFPTAGWIDSAPAVGHDGTVYFGSWDGYFYAVSASGDLVWEYDAGDIIFSSPAIGDDGSLYFGAGNELFALDSGGNLLWKFETDHEDYLVDSSPVIGPDGAVFVGAGHGSVDGGHVYAVNPKNGTEIWSFATNAEVFSSPAVAADGTVYVGDGAHQVYAIDSEGQLVWKHTTGDWVDSSPAIAPDGSVYVGSYDHDIYAFQGDHPLALSRWPQFGADCVRSGDEPNSLSVWLESHGLNQEYPDSAYASPAGDGVANLLKYAFGYFPEDTVSEPDGVERTEEGVVYSFPKDRRKRDVLFLPQMSSDLAEWEEPGYEVEESPKAITRGKVTLPPEEDPRYFRLKVRLKSGFYDKD